jgi:hypothetical protein
MVEIVRRFRHHTDRATRIQNSATFAYDVPQGHDLGADRVDQLWVAMNTISHD